MKRNTFSTAVKDFRRLSQVAKREKDDTVRLEDQPELVSRYYDVVTKFYEFAWGTHFHFAPRQPGESLQTSQRRHEEQVVEILNLQPGMRVADVGCGVGGPLVTIGGISGASITGINFNQQQIRRGEANVLDAGLSETCRFLYANFMDVPLDDGTFDAIYLLEAACHAPNRSLLFKEMHRLLKSGGEIAIIDWCLTEIFDENDARHVDIRLRIEETQATPDLLVASQYGAIVKEAGFEVIQELDQQIEDGNPATPWYMALQGRDLSFSSLARSPIGRRLTAVFTQMFESVWVLPEGTTEASKLLNVGADALVEGGELGIFTPSYLIHARKP